MVEHMIKGQALATTCLNTSNPCKPNHMIKGQALATTCLNTSNPCKPNFIPFQKQKTKSLLIVNS